MHQRLFGVACCWEVWRWCFGAANLVLPKKRLKVTHSVCLSACRGCCCLVLPQRHLTHLESQPAEHELMLAGLNNLIKISYVDDTEVFKSCLDYWQLFVADIFGSCTTHALPGGCTGAHGVATGWLYAPRVKHAWQQLDDIPAWLVAGFSVAGATLYACTRRLTLVHGCCFAACSGPSCGR